MATFLSKLIGKRKTASELVDLMASTEAELADGEARRGELVGRRQKLLLEGSDEEVDQLDAEIAEAKRQCDRLVAALDEIDQRIKAARDREHEDYLNRVAALGERLTERALGNYRSYAAAANKLTDMAVEDQVIYERLREVNGLLREAGRPEVVAPERRASTRPDGGSGPGLYRKLVLPNPGDPHHDIYNKALFEKIAARKPAAIEHLDREVGAIPAAPAPPPAGDPEDIDEAA